MIQTILIANRGEIAVRIMRACREMGIGTVAIYSDVDREARHVRYADRAFPLAGNAPGDTYLRIDKILEIARRSGADAVHPGYGFLAENEAFARACVDAGLTFIGPPPEVIARMGSKTAARDSAIAAGAPVVPGTQTPVAADVPDADVQRLADVVGYPLMVKAVAGGGGKGMREVRTAGDLLDAVRTARSEALGAFGDAAVYFERRLQRPRHIEIQLLADQHGTVVPFVERECSVQRRHQKVIEESPAPRMDDDLRRRMAEAAASVARTVGYTNAGTIEFLVDAEDRFYFLEMNTRLQVEHPVTEMVTGVDLVQWQIRIARGERLTVSPEQALTPRGHAIECRVYAEDPDQRFMPRPGRITSLTVPGGPGIRDDSGVEAGFEVPIYYDSMISKLVAWADTREEARRRMLRALGEYHVGGIPTTLPFFRWMLQQPAFIAGELDTTMLDAELERRDGQPFLATGPAQDETALLALASSVFLAGRRPTADRRRRRRRPPLGLGCRRQAVRAEKVEFRVAMRLHIEQDGRVRQVTVTNGRAPGSVDVHVDDTVIACDVRDLGQGRLSLRLTDGSMHDLVVETEAPAGHRVVHVEGVRVRAVVSTRVRRGASAAGAAVGPLRIVAPMPGKVVRVPVRPGDQVDARQPVVVIEAMKMENALSAGRAGVVREVLVQEGMSVEAGRPLVVLE